MAIGSLVRLFESYENFPGTKFSLGFSLAGLGGSDPDPTKQSIGEMNGAHPLRETGQRIP